MCQARCRRLRRWRRAAEPACSELHAWLPFGQGVEDLVCPPQIRGCKDPHHDELAQGEDVADGQAFDDFLAHEIGRDSGQDDEAEVPDKKKIVAGTTKRRFLVTSSLNSGERAAASQSTCCGRCDILSSSGSGFLLRIPNRQTGKLIRLVPARISPRRAAFAGIFVVTGLGLLSVGATLPVIPRYVQGPIGGSALRSGSSPAPSRSQGSPAGRSLATSPIAAAGAPS